MRAVVDLLRYWRACDLDYHPLYGLPIVIFFAATAGLLGWWSALVLIPTAALLIYVFRFDAIIREHA